MNIEKTNRSSLIIGSVIVVLGLLLFISQITIDHFDLVDFIFEWSTVMLILGIVIIYKNKSSFWGWLFLTFGVISTLHYFFEDINFHGFFAHFWPFILIAFGLSLLFKKKHHHENHDDCCFKNEEYVEGGINENLLNDDAVIFSKKTKKVNSIFFEGGSATAIFGKYNLDLTTADLRAGSNVLTLTAVFGHFEIFVPEGWQIKSDITPIFGGYTDKRRVANPVSVDTDKTLTIKGTFIFGGCLVRN